jgi:hypothetical protein
VHILKDLGVNIIDLLGKPATWYGLKIIGLDASGWYPAGKKAAATRRTPNGAIYKGKYSKCTGSVKE